MTLLNSILLGIVEGITEFLPISSTAHLEIASYLMKISQTEFVKTFEIFIQSGAILAVVVLYARRLSRDITLWKKIIVAFIPTATIGLILHKFIKQYLLGNYSIIIWTLALGGIIIIIFEMLHAKRTEEMGTYELNSMSYKTAFVIGIAQSLAVIPGVSRSAATIIAGLALKMKRIAIVEFSFLLAIPTILAASGYDLLKTSYSFTANDFWILAAGFISAFVSALCAIQFLLRFIEKRNFIVFGVYRIILAIVLLFVFI